MFDHVRVLKNHAGFKILLEEDNYLAPDTISTVGACAALHCTVIANSLAPAGIGFGVSF